MRNTMFSSSTMMDEVVNHRYYSPDDEANLDQHSKRDTLSMSHPTQSDSQQDVVDRSTDCASPCQDLEGKNRNSTRRRIQVACNRCRKRKIKCSGDIGDGQGCTNCRSSGNTNCQFLRVNSSMLRTKTAWPYPTVSPAMSPSQRLCLSASPMAQRLGMMSANSPNFRVASFSRPSTCYLGSVNPQNEYSRPDFVDPTMSYENSSAPYNSHNPAYMNSTPHGMLADYCGISMNPKTLSSFNATRSMFPDRDAEDLTQSAYSYMFSIQEGQSTDLSSMVPVMTPILESQGTYRTLSGSTRRGQMQMGASSFMTSPEPISGQVQPQDNRVGTSWASKRAISNEGHNAMPLTSSEAFNMTAMSRNKAMPPPPQDMLPILPIRSTESPSPLLSPSDASLETVDSSDAFRSTGGLRPSRSSSREHSARHMSLSEPSSEFYSYSSVEKRNRSDADGSGSVLVNGLPYTRPKYSGTQHDDHLSPSGVHDYRSSTNTTEMNHLAMVSALSSPGGF